jgi:hypothetical protein
MTDKKNIFGKISVFVDGLQKNPWKLFLLIFLLASLARIVFVSTMEDKWYFYDTVYYDKAAQSILAGEGFGRGYKFSGLIEFSDEYSLPPVYPIFLAGVYSVFGRDFLAVRIMQSIIGAITCLIIFKIGRELFNKNAGLLAAAVAALYPLFVFISGLMYSTELFMFFIALFVWFALKSSTNDKMKYPIFSGLFLGLGTLAGPILFILFPVVCFWYLIILNKSLRMKIVGCAILVGIAILTLIPWGIRNYKIFGRITPVSASADWFLAEAQSKIQNEMSVQIRIEDSRYHFDIYVNGEYDGTLTDTTNFQKDGSQLYAGIYLQAGYINTIDEFSLRKDRQEHGSTNVEEPVELEDDFERVVLGTEWLAPSFFEIENGKLKSNAKNIDRGFFAIYKELSNPSEVTIKMGADTDMPGIDRTGIVLVLNEVSHNADGYYIKRDSIGRLVLWLIENGLPTSILANETGNKAFASDSGDSSGEKGKGSQSGFVGRAFGIVTKNPRSFFAHYFSEFIHFWQIYPDRVTTENEYTNWKTTLISIISFGPILLFGIIGMIISRTMWRRSSLLFLTIISFALGYSFFHTQIRYRIPIEPYLIIFAAFGFLEILNRIKKIKTNSSEGVRS